ncbi:hypothetical protein NM688_g5075 [Phlebia brevispora]|uniref:Uncharacterized protein n=1 Tax=Phlebia brevispora TaxID=194682 RepID=A0ACC1T1A9_9APHY|nr:hypothetical protein NM688_g5075 [Phlebia brevispora]
MDGYEGVPAESPTASRNETIIQAQVLEFREQPASKLASLIERLPNEILGEIFIFVMSLFLDSYATDYGELYCWIPITRVCRHWYNVAVQVPVLWAWISLPNDETVVELLLRRSKGTSLYVMYDDSNAVPPSDGVTVLKHVLKDHLSRIRDLFLNINPTAFEEIRDKLSEPAPKLTVWHMRTYSRGNDLPEAYLDHQNMPSLKAFRNSGNYNVPWAKLASMSTLRELNLSYDRPRADIMLSKVLDTLVGMPLLETLRLSGLSIVVGRTTQKISLARLSLCKVHAPPIICSAILQHILTPSDMKMHISHTELRDTDRPLLMVPVLSKLSGETTLSPPHPIITLGVICGHDSVTLYGWRSMVAFEDPTCNGFEEVCTFRVHIRSAEPLADLLKTLPLQSVQQLQIHSHLFPHEELSPSEVVDLAMLSDKMPNISTLMCARWPLSSCADVLCNPYISVSGSGFAWPSLHTLVLQNVSFRSTGGLLDMVYSPDDGLSIMPLWRGLLKRQTSGCSILDRLVIRKCAVKDEDLDLFKQCCDELVSEHNDHRGLSLAA